MRAIPLCALTLAALLSSARALSDVLPTETEDNDTIPTADVVPRGAAGIEGEVSSGDPDFLRFTLAPGEGLSYQASTVTAGGSCDEAPLPPSLTLLSLSRAVIGVSSVELEEREAARLEVPYDGLDQDGDDGDLVDVDGDGYSALDDPGERDCNDTNPNMNPGEMEVNDGIDNDCDGLRSDSSNGGEIIVDLDGDGLLDVDEEDWGMNPKRADMDNDGLPDGYENDIKTNPDDADTDDDGWTDFQEVTGGTDPLDGGDQPSAEASCLASATFEYGAGDAARVLFVQLQGEGTWRVEIW